MPAKRFYEAHKEQLNAQNRQYKKTHRKQINKQEVIYKKAHKEYFKPINKRKHSRYQKNSSHFHEYRLNNRIYNIWKNSIIADRKTKRENNIDLEFLYNLLELQNWTCAATGIKMTNNFNDLKSASLDRIDSSKGHIKGNVQFVCLFYNYGKRHRSDAEARALIQEIEMNLLKELKARGCLKIGSNQT